MGILVENNVLVSRKKSDANILTELGYILPI